MYLTLQYVIYICYFTALTNKHFQSGGIIPGYAHNVHDATTIVIINVYSLVHTNDKDCPWVYIHPAQTLY